VPCQRPLAHEAATTGHKLQLLSAMRSPALQSCSRRQTATDSSTLQALHGEPTITHPTINKSRSRFAELAGGRALGGLQDLALEPEARVYVLPASSKARCLLKRSSYSGGTLNWLRQGWS
jgi:hypothetical protein